MVLKNSLRKARTLRKRQTVCILSPCSISSSVDESRYLDSETDVENLITKTETEGDQEDPGASANGLTFSFAKIWAADKDGLEEMADEDAVAVQADAWAQTLQRMADERAKMQAAEVNAGGRPSRRAAVMAMQKPQVSPQMSHEPATTSIIHTFPPSSTSTWGIRPLRKLLTTSANGRRAPCLMNPTASRAPRRQLPPMATQLTPMLQMSLCRRSERLDHHQELPALHLGSQPHPAIAAYVTRPIQVLAKWPSHLRIWLAIDFPYWWRRRTSRSRSGYVPVYVIDPTRCLMRL